ncbi:Dolichyl-diphosphooligosaccharide--protein glycosyltransferase subunit Swp1 [Dipodascopsis uninucleata]
MWNAIIYCLVAFLTLPLTSVAWSLKESVISVNERGTVLETASFTSSEPVVQILSVPSGATVRVKFHIQSDLAKASSKPHQSYVLLEDNITGLETVFTGEVRDNGIGKIDIENKMIPSALLSSGNPLDVTMVLGSFGEEPGLKVKIGSILPKTSSAIPALPLRYGPKPNIFHTFRSDPTFVATPIAMFFSFIVVVCLVILFVTWFFLGASTSAYVDAVAVEPLGHFGSLFSLFSIELMFFYYYKGESIFTLMSQLAVLVPIGLFCGKRALNEIRNRRQVGKW